jgi:hypothetical protein
MKRLLMFMAWQNGHCENGCTTKATYIFNANLIKMGNFSYLFTEEEKSFLKFVWMHKRPQTHKLMLSKKEQHHRCSNYTT